MAQTIGERIALLRKERHITQTELAEYLVLVPQTISKWEVGNGTPDVALLPRIADFFGISVDELFGRSSLEHAKDLVLKYSVLRDENSFQEALGCLHLQLRTIDAELESGMGDRERLERDRVELQGLEMHLLLQQSWEAAGRALKIAEELADRTGDIRFRLQRLQLHMELGDNRGMLGECERKFAEAPGIDTLRIYFEALLILGRYEDILKIREEDPEAMALMTPPAGQNMAVWMQCARAAAGTGNVRAAEEYADLLLKYGGRQEKYEALWTLARLYKEKGMREKCEGLKEQLAGLTPQENENPYVTARNRQRIERL